MALTLPFVQGRRLVDLVNELERRLTGDAPGGGLAPDLADAVPDAATYVLVLFDGLGHHQLDHPAARTLRAASVGVVSAPFPSTTTVSLATIATGSSPETHGMIGHMMWLPEVGRVVNVLKWVTPDGSHVSHDTTSFLPQPNLWERLRRAGIESITVQPAEFERTPLTRALYRGCRFDGVSGVDEAIEATAVLSRQPGRLILTYFNQVDFTAHLWGQRSDEYAGAVRLVDTAWSHITSRVAPGVVVVGTADHGHLDYRPEDKLLIRDAAFDELTFFGDSRSLYVSGDRHRIAELASAFDVEPHWVVSPDPLWPAAHHPRLGERLPDAVLMAPAGRILLPRGFDKRLVGYHGGVTDQELEIPVLLG
jgi:predicted AlkP superfamily pyrophosphatase or phosphodiesterase